MKTLKQQVCGILNGKIQRIAQREFAAANPDGARKHRAYSLPAEVGVLVEMLGRIETASDSELEAMASFATSPRMREMTSA